MEILGTKTFVGKFEYTDIELQALKIMEEAAEVFDAAKKINCIDEVLGSDYRRERVLEEGCDVLQATFNLLDMMGFDFSDIIDGMEECCRRNKYRGRYE